MKKLIFIIVLIIGFTFEGFSQRVNYDYGKKYDVPTFTVDNDTSYIYSTFQQNRVWSFQFTWAGLDKTDAYIVVYTRLNYIDWIPYPNIDTLFLSTAAGSSILRDVGNGTTENEIRFGVESGTNTTGTLKVTGNINRKN